MKADGQVDQNNLDMDSDVDVFTGALKLFFLHLNYFHFLHSRRLLVQQTNAFRRRVLRVTVVGWCLLTSQALPLPKRSFSNFATKRQFVNECKRLQKKGIVLNGRMPKLSFIKIVMAHNYVLGCEK
ncbi:hypothetical protein J437_LFUL017517 [Ladona fulva]|uniref:Uncharacterized protein n=1 Tax=Ladona fulva TaxID=123851 RepID=A0A8K0KNR3_LADFU|nr:hypothetical protein J437_LFUL017517 [Ladona fulva]